MDIMSLLQQIIGQQQNQPDLQRQAIMRRMGNMASQQPQQNPNFQTMPQMGMQLPPAPMPQINPWGGQNFDPGFNIRPEYYQQMRPSSGLGPQFDYNADALSRRVQRAL